MTATAQDAYQERLNRILDAVALKVPDRIPVLLINGFHAAKYGNINLKDAYHDPEKWYQANKKMLLELQPDIYQDPWMINPAKAMEALDFKQIKWPGHGIPEDHSFQFVEDEYMKPEEYDALMDDPSDFAVRTYLPRICGALEAFKTLPTLKAFLTGYPAIGVTAAYAQPEVVAAFESLAKAGREYLKYIEKKQEFYKEMAEFPVWGVVGVVVPFDLISDMLRGMRGSMLDMYRNPDKLLEAQEKLYPMVRESAIVNAKINNTPFVFMALHRGADGFMSIKQFEKFYWPYLKRLILDTIDAGLIPFVCFEGSYDERLEYLKELPKGKIIAWLDSTDIFKAKKVIGDTHCIAGNLPVSLLQTGTPEKVKDYTKKLIDEVGRDGGYIMSTRGVLDEADPELVKVWVEFTKEYGVYK